MLPLDMFLILIVFNVDKTVHAMEITYSTMRCLTSSLFALVGGWTRDLDWQLDLLNSYNSHLQVAEVEVEVEVMTDGQ
jgi:hypothetical protein